MDTLLIENAFIVVLCQVVQKVSVEKSGYPLVYKLSFYGNLILSETCKCVTIYGLFLLFLRQCEVPYQFISIYFY